MRASVFLSLWLATFGCDQTSDFIKELNDPPTINFMEGSANELPILTDSIKLSLKNSQVSYPVALRIFDANNNIREVRYSQVLGLGTLLQDGDTIMGNNVLVDSDQLEFEYFPRNTGLHTFRLTVIDNFELFSDVTIELQSFDNLLPNAALTVSKIGQRSRYEYRLDGSESFDRDQRFGGRVVEYEFSVLGKVFNVLQDQIIVIFPEDGIYTIGLRVRDNDGRWSGKRELDVVVD